MEGTVFPYHTCPPMARVCDQGRNLHVSTLAFQKCSGPQEVRRGPLWLTTSNVQRHICPWSDAVRQTDHLGLPSQVRYNTHSCSFVDISWQQRGCRPAANRLPCKLRRARRSAVDPL